MRSFWFRGVTLGGAALMALGMLGLNIVFQAAGSIPDIETVGFLSGNLIALLLLYPLCAGLVAARTVSPLARRYPNLGDDVVRVGGRIGLWGALAYFAANVALTIASPHQRLLPPLLWALIVLYAFASLVGGRVGAAVAADRSATRVPLAPGS